MCGLDVFYEEGDAGPADPSDDSDDSRWCDMRPAEFGVKWPLLCSQDDGCIRSAVDSMLPTAGRANPSMTTCFIPGILGTARSLSRGDSSERYLSSLSERPVSTGSSLEGSNSRRPYCSAATVSGPPTGTYRGGGRGGGAWSCDDESGIDMGIEASDSEEVEKVD